MIEEYEITKLHQVIVIRNSADDKVLCMQELVD
jgi:hypothetical protein